MSNFASGFYGYSPTGGMNNEITELRALLQAPEKVMLQQPRLFQHYSPSSCSSFSNLMPGFQFCIFPIHGFLYQSYCPTYNILFPASQACPFLTYISWFSLLASPCSPRLLQPLPVQVSSSRRSQSRSHCLVSLSHSSCLVSPRSWKELNCFVWSFPEEFSLRQLWSIWNFSLNG